MVLDAPVAARPTAAAAAAGGVGESVEGLDEAVVGVRVLADDRHVVPAIGGQDAHDGGGGERADRVHLQVHRPTALDTGHTASVV